MEENCIARAAGKFNVDEFDIKEIYRYEGESDPGDEATVYGIESNSGVKGILVSGAGTSSDFNTNILLNKRKLQNK